MFSLLFPIAQSTSFTAQQNKSLSWDSFEFPCFSQLGTGDDDSLEEYYSKSVTLNKQQCQVLLKLTLRKTGCFRARISYTDQPLSNGEFDIIVLSGEQPLHA